ncbi:MAG: hypothetical protein ACJAXQ_000290 [Parvibaculaceae bacterium]|jgi:hypothetical protein
MRNVMTYRDAQPHPKASSSGLSRGSIFDAFRTSYATPQRLPTAATQYLQSNRVSLCLDMPKIEAQAQHLSEVQEPNFICH